MYHRVMSPGHRWGGSALECPPQAAMMRVQPPLPAIHVVEARNNHALENQGTNIGISGIIFATV